MPQVFHDLMKAELLRLAEIGAPLTDEQIETFVEECVTQGVNEVSRQLESDMSRMLLDQRSRNRKFQRRNTRRWGAALDILEAIWVISFEAGEEFSKEYTIDDESVGGDNFLALRHLHARSLLVVREIICLIEGGFADGALSRWRTLHELAVVARFIAAEDETTAHRYMLSFNFKAFQAAKQLNEYAERSGLQKFSDHEIEEFKKLCEANALEHGREMYEDYGWASKILGHSRVNFAQIEKRVHLDHWRPRYRWASTHTHSGFRPERSALGLAESSAEFLLAGQSNAGMVDPLQMAAMTLNIVNSAFLLYQGTLDGAIIIKIVDEMADRIGEVALGLQRSSLALHQAKNGTELQMSAMLDISAEGQFGNT